MPKNRSTLTILPCMDSDDMAFRRHRELRMSRENAAMLGSSAVDAARQGFYINNNGEKVDWKAQVAHACSSKESIRPDSQLPPTPARSMLKPGYRCAMKQPCRQLFV